MRSLDAIHNEIAAHVDARRASGAWVDVVHDVAVNMRRAPACPDVWETTVTLRRCVEQRWVSADVKCFSRDGTVPPYLFEHLDEAYRRMAGEVNR